MNAPRKSRAPLVSVICVNFNGGNILLQCVRSVLTSTVPVQVIVSDNGSTDGSIAALEEDLGNDERLVIIENHENLGFARGNNVALSQAEGEYILFLNPDCRIRPDTIERMIDHSKRLPEAGLLGCLICNPDGSEQAGCRRRVPTPWRAAVRFLGLHHLFPHHAAFRDLNMHELPLPEAPVEVEAISGAFMFVPREALEDVGPLDEGYFLHCEDLDWCMRFRQKGWKVMFIPDVSIVHEKGGCSRRRKIRVEWHKHCGMVRFYRKFFRYQYPLPFMWLVIFAVWFRFGLMACYLTIRERI
ncbi:MAG: glycosyltransferase family 2 protein [Zetaproteobacteria bacterium]|nr:MAG: glycosyltransferase family 2 protein [Zetaproteobacteria bacterium]